MQTEFVPADFFCNTNAFSEIAHDLFHLPEYQNLSANLERGEAHYFFAREADSAMIVPLLVRRVDEALSAGLPSCFDATSAYSFASPLFLRAEGDFSARAVEEFLRLLRQHHIVSCFLRLHPLLEAPIDLLRNYGKIITHGNTVSVDLTLEDATIWEQFRKSHRRNINKAEAKGYRAEVDPDWCEAASFAEIYEAAMRRRNAHAYYRFPRRYFEELRRGLGGRIHLVVVRKGAEIAAASLYTEHGGFVTAFLGGTADAFMEDGPLKLADHFVCFWMKRRGNHTFHLGGGVGGADDSLFQYKAGFSPRRHPYCTWQVIVDLPVYEALSDAWQERNPDRSPGDFFPAYRSPL